MGDVSATLHSGLSVREAAAAFQVIADQARGLKAKIAERSARSRGGNELHGFFTPRNDSAFAGLDEDVPDFKVACGIATGMPWLSGLGGRDADVIHLYVWDRGDHRELELYSPYSRMKRGRSVKLVERFIDGYQQADQQLQIVQGIQ